MGPAPAAWRRDRLPQQDRASLRVFLDRLNLRSDLTSVEQRAVLDLPGFPVELEANIDHIALGEVTEFASLVVTGVLGRFGQNARGDRQITALHVPGDMANLQSVVEPRATSALQALCLTRILKIPHHALRSAAARHPALAEALWRDCMVDAAILSQWVVNIGRRDAVGRIAHLLCETATRQGIHGIRPGSFEFPLTQNQIADATGMTSVHVNRTLKALRSVVTLAGRSAHVLDWAGLVELADFDPAYLQRGMAPSGRLRIARPD